MEKKVSSTATVDMHKIQHLSSNAKFCDHIISVIKRSLKTKLHILEAKVEGYLSNSPQLFYCMQGIAQ